MNGDPGPSLPARRPRLVRALLASLLVALLAALLLGTGLSPAAAQVYSSPATGSHDVYGAILERYRASGGPAGVHGYPTTDEQNAVGGRRSLFQNGAIYWSQQTGAHSVSGAIWADYDAVGRETSLLGFPVTDEHTTPNGRGRVNGFQGGVVLWAPGIGAHAVYGSIAATYGALGWENSLLRFPVTDEMTTSNGRGRFNRFEGGVILWTPAAGARAVYGAIVARYDAMGSENSVLGFPVTDERSTPNLQGRFNHFEHGSIYWSAPGGAHAVYGAIRERWGQAGWENSALGFPVSDEYSIPGGRAQDFQYGSITWTPGGGAVLAGAPRAGGGTLPLGVRPPGSQAVTVTAAPGATSGTLTAWELRADGWHSVLSVPARVGAAGIGVAAEGSTRTPVGTWTMTEAFGRVANPGTVLPYRYVDGDDWWVGDVRSPRYNEYAQCLARTCPFDERASENLWAIGAVYDLAVVLDYNRPAVAGAGSAFFLHIANASATGGCVAVDRTALTTLLRWLRPDARPVITIGTV